MVTVEPTGEMLGATVRGVDLKCPLDAEDVRQIAQAICRHGYVRFPDQKLEPPHQKSFAENFGHVPPIQGRIAEFVASGVPEVSILSNITENGSPIGFPDAGVIWHTDMSQRQVPGFANVLYALRVPFRDGRPLGATEFISMRHALEELDPATKAKLRNARGVYTGINYNSLERKPVEHWPGNAEYMVKKARVEHPVILRHPVTGEETLYCDPGHVDTLVGVPEDEAADLLQYVLNHVMRPEYRYMYHWALNDLLIWDNLTTLHRGTFDYGPDEGRLIHRCQVLGDKVFSGAFTTAHAA
jgi:taurine dioxygenase